MNRKRQPAEKTKPLSVAERKAIVAAVAKTASPKVKRGLAMIDFRETPPPKVRAHADMLVASGRLASARARARKAA